MKIITATLAAFFLVVAFTASPVVAQNEITLPPVKDTSLYEDTAGVFGNGSGQYLFAGRTGRGLRRRTLLAFDVAGTVPAGATISEAEIILNLSRSPGGTLRVGVHALTADWGEGASDASREEGGGAPAMEGDATWVHTSFNTEKWQAPGGDFEQVELAGTEVGAVEGPYTWSGEPLTADAQRWLDTPAENFGWILIGDETRQTTARRFDSRENPSEGTGPKLRLVFSIATAVSGDEVPGSLTLKGNYPNPFRGATSINYELSSARFVTLVVHDIHGREVATLVNGFQSSGSHAVVLDASSLRLAPGPYFYRLAAGNLIQSSKLVVMP